jgi:hypothetical protein
MLLSAHGVSFMWAVISQWNTDVAAIQTLYSRLFSDQYFDQRTLSTHRQFGHVVRTPSSVQLRRTFDVTSQRGDKYNSITWKLIETI